jgi:signal transduction histidine kinase/DNA-binding response OmpR family regulator
VAWCLLVLALATASLSRADEVPLRQYRQADGRSLEMVRAMAQSADGLLWFGTMTGLVVYDGQTFQEVPLPDSIGPASVNHLTAMPDSSVWFTAGPSGLLQAKRGRVTGAMPQLAGHFSTRLVARGDTLHLLADDAYWTLVPCRDAVQKTPLRYPEAFLQPYAGNPDAIVIRGHDLAFDPRGRPWILDGRYGPGRIRSDGSVHFHGWQRTPRGGQDWWNHLRFLPDGRALVTSGGSIRVQDPTTPPRPPLRQGARVGRLYQAGGTVYVPTREGLLRWSVAENRLLDPLGEPHGLPTDYVRAALEDHEGGLWLATSEGLVHLFAPGVRHVRKVDGEEVPFVDKFTVTSDGALWARSFHSGLIRIAPDPAHVTPADWTEWELVDGLDGQAHLVGTPGWYRFEAGTRWQRIGDRERGVRPFVGPDGMGYFWHSSGIYQHDPADPNDVRPLATWPLDARDYHVMTLAPDGDVIYRNRDLLLRATPDVDRPSATTWDTLATLPGFAEARTRYMHFDDAGRAWLPFWQRGLVLVDTRAPDPAPQVLLPNEPMWQVTPSGDSLVFAAAKNGLWIVDGHDAALRWHLTSEDGLLSNYVSSARIYGDTLYAGHTMGLTKLPLNELYQAPSVPTTLIRTVERPSGTYAPTASPPFEADERSVGLTFAATSYTYPQRVQYQYRLAGYQDAWQQTERPFAEFTNLSPGRYRFEVRARVQGGQAGPVATYAFHVPALFYETWTFRGLVLLLLGMLAAGGYYVRVHRLKRREEELRHLVEERTQRLAAAKRKTEAQAQRLLELDEAKRRFLANLSHEFRTPLTLTLGPLRDVLDTQEEVLPDTTRTKLTAAHRNARRLLRLVDELLDLARLEAKTLTLERTPTDLVALTQRLVRSCMPLAERNGIALHLSTPSDVVQGRVDPGKVEKVVLNLLTNALKFTPEGGKVHVSVARRAAQEERWVEIAVQDTGCGIPEDEQDRLFERFYQGDGSSTRKHQGTGIGLSLAKELVDLHGGAIAVESTPGFGSTFTVRLPLQPDAVPGHAESAAAAGDGALGGDGAALVVEDVPTPSTSTPTADPPEDAPTVLVVEDNAEVRAFLREHLATRYRVLEAADGAEGLRQARESRPDLILCDVMMPEVDGVTLCQQLRAEEATAAVPVILLTARAGEEAEVEGLAVGADAYVTKPFSIQTLVARIEALLTSRRRLRDHFGETVLVGPDAIDATPEEAAFLEQALAVVEEHLDDADFKVAAFAGAMGLSPRQLRRRLKALIDETPAAFVRRYRLERGRQLLEARVGTIAEVAYQVGFSSPDYFSRCFREAFGQTPSAYRQAQA